MDMFLKSVSALNDETRIRLLKFMSANGKVCVCDLEKSFDMIQSRLSRHLKILKEAGYLDLNREGRWAYYNIKNSLDTFLKASLTQINTLDLDIPKLQKAC
ncbi:MAG: winged helix-turn-helix transcriptional regulator [Campylobacteraceae bacterium]|nr:winged helix-turn-helix transcriptional regulator [Campylobacteraceae bacterium]